MIQVRRVMSVLLWLRVPLWVVTCRAHGLVGLRVDHREALALAHRHCRAARRETQRDYGLASP